MDLEQTIDNLIDVFAMLPDWEERYGYVIDLGRKLPTYPEALRDETHRVQGCISQVWLHFELRSDGRLWLQGDSDAAIVKGLVALLLTIYSGRTATEALAIDIRDVFKRLGLEEHLTPTRRNGFFSMVQQIHHQYVQLKKSQHIATTSETSRSPSKTWTQTGE